MRDSTETAAVLALIEERLEAMRQRDAVRAIATLAPDVVAFELAPPLGLSGAAARDTAALEAWFAGWSGELGFEVRDLVIEVSGDVAYSHSLNRLAGMRTDGRQVEFWMRSTLGFRQIDGAWKIAHGHTSVPFHMDGSFRAALDLKPHSD